MPALQVRDLPQDLYDQLVELSRQDHRSIAQETTFIIEEYCSEAYAASGLRETGRHIRPARHEHEDQAQRRSRVMDQIIRLPRFDVPSTFPSVPEILDEECEAR